MVENHLKAKSGKNKHYEVFSEVYSKYYDILYADKDYERECDFIEQIFQRYASSKLVSILDVGCGTGGHLIPLARRGYEVVGVDKSKSMVQIARTKLRKLGLNAEVYVSDAAEFTFNTKFDACISMFAVINYIVETDRVIKVFRNIRKHLKKNSLFIFDSWYGPAVLSIKPSVRVKIIERGGLKVIRTVIPELDTFRHIQKSNYYLIVIKDNKVIGECRECHTLRYFFPQELIHYLTESGFSVLKFCKFLHIDEPPSENTWNVTIIAKAV